jgi:glycosyltransferase involved in cell wall biosynthesis
VNSGRLRRLEQKTLHQAGKVVFTANSNRQTYIEAGLVPRLNTEHVPYFYDEEAFHLTGAVGPLFEIGYYGNFDLTGSRNPRTFLASLAGFLKRHPEARGQTRFQFHGAWLDSHDALLDQLALRDVCRISKAVPYQDYLEKLKQSPVLLLVIAEAHNFFMPSKIVDYFGARRPILAFVPPKSEMHDVLVEAGMEDYLCGDTDVEEGILALEGLWKAYGFQSLQVDSSRTSKWSSSTQVSRYIRMLEAPTGGTA